MNKKISLGAAIAYMLILAAAVYSLTMVYARHTFNSKLKNQAEREAMYLSLSELDQYVRNHYLEPIDEEFLNDEILSGYVNGLNDPYARLMTAAEYEAYTADNSQYTGIGVVTERDADGYIKIVEVYADSPAESAGLQPGNIITSVNGTSATMDNYSELLSAFQGEVGSTITFMVRQEEEEREMTLTRRTVNVTSLYAENFDGVGYIRITDITNATASRFERAVSQLRGEEVSALIFDLRGVQSDDMQSIGEMLDLLLPRLPLIYATYQDGRVETIYTSDNKEIDLPMVVMIDSETMGSPEMFAMALKDCGKALTVGEISYGKGTMQEAKRLRDGSALLLTTAVYSGPLGETYNETGVSVDYSTDNGDELQQIGDPEYDSVLRKALEVAHSQTAAASQ